MFEAATETPAFLGCPQHMPKALPGGFDGTEPATPSEEAKKLDPQNTNAAKSVVRPQRLSDIGMSMEKRVTTDENGVVTRIHYAGIRHLTGCTRAAQLWEIVIAKAEREDGGKDSHINIFRDHERIFSGTAFFGLSAAADVAISMMIRKIIGDVDKKYRDHFRTIRRATATVAAENGGQA